MLTLNLFLKSVCASIIIASVCLSTNPTTQASVDYHTRHPAADNQFPYMVYIYMEFEEIESTFFLCGGVILDVNHVLTSASCFVYSPTIEVETDYICITAGSNAQVNTTYTHRIVNYDIMQSYSSTTGYVNDLIMLKISPDFVFSSQISPITVSDSWSDVSGNCALPTWFDGMDWNYLYWYNVGQFDCARNDSLLYCAGDPIQQTSVTTRDDIGGAMVCNERLVGLVTLNENSQYLTNITEHHNWIEQYLGQTTTEASTSPVTGTTVSWSSLSTTATAEPSTGTGTTVTGTSSPTTPEPTTATGSTITGTSSPTTAMPEPTTATGSTITGTSSPTTAMPEPTTVTGSIITGTSSPTTPEPTTVTGSTITWTSSPSTVTPEPTILSTITGTSSPTTPEPTTVTGSTITWTSSPSTATPEPTTLSTITGTSSPTTPEPTTLSTTTWTSSPSTTAEPTTAIGTTVRATSSPTTETAVPTTETTTVESATVTVTTDTSPATTVQSEITIPPTLTTTQGSSSAGFSIIISWYVLVAAVFIVTTNTIVHTKVI